MKPIARLWRFGSVGGLATLVHVGVGMGVHHLAGAAPLVANTVAFSAAVLVSFHGQTRLTFPDARRNAAAFLRFVATALAGFALSQFIVWIVTGPSEERYWLALALSVATVPALTFILLRHWALRPPR